MNKNLPIEISQIVVALIIAVLIFYIQKHKWIGFLLLGILVLYWVIPPLHTLWRKWREKKVEIQEIQKEKEELMSLLIINGDHFWLEGYEYSFFKLVDILVKNENQKIQLLEKLKLILQKREILLFFGKKYKWPSKDEFITFVNQFLILLREYQEILKEFIKADKKEITEKENEKYLKFKEKWTFGINELESFLRKSKFSKHFYSFYGFDAFSLPNTLIVSIS